MNSRVAIACVLLAAALAGLLFAPVFGAWPLLPPIAIVVLACFAVTQLCARWPALVPWRAPLALLAGLLGLAETLLWRTTVSGLPTGATARSLSAGVIESWQLTLQSTWPARPDAELLLFVPLAVLAAAVLGIELLDRLRRPLVSLIPAVVVLGLSQTYGALTGPSATVAGLAFAGLAAALLITTPRPADQGPSMPRPVVALATVLLGAVGAIVGTAVNPGGRPAYSLREHQSAPLPPARVINPLDEVADRLHDPDRPVFSYTAMESVDHWRLVVLDSFDGTAWTTRATYRRMGTTLGPPRWPASLRTARVNLAGTDGPWMPSQPLPASVTGVAPLIDEASGMLLVPDRSGPAEYELSWWEPQIDPADLSGAAVDPVATGGFGNLGAIPPGVSELARTAVGGMRPSFQAALVLERYLSSNYRVASGTDLPTGNGWPQLRTFLLESKRGTSEQFAAAYVALARIVGIPTRLAVGYRAPDGGSDRGTDRGTVVRNEDVLAWPEVAVAGVGWVPLDPTGSATRSGAPGGLAAGTAQARAQLPPPQDLVDPELPEKPSSAAAGHGGAVSVPVLTITIIAGALGLVAAWLVGVPLLQTLRAWRRRRRPGARGVVGAWFEARDRLRAHGVPFTDGMTVRDLATAAVPLMQPSIVDGLQSLARSVDAALWSGTAPGERTVDEAWAAVRTVRRGLARRPVTERLRAAVDPRSLLPPGQHPNT
jgi:protein-glutamine gamma-glutamyltransferase